MKNQNRFPALRCLPALFPLLLLLLGAAAATAQPPLVVANGTTVTIVSNTTYGSITIEPRALLVVTGPKVTLNVNDITVQEGGTLKVSDANINFLNANGVITALSGVGPNTGSVLYFSKSKLYGATGLWKGVSVQGLGSNSLNQQQDKTVARAVFEDTKITGSQYGVCNHEFGPISNKGGGVIQVTRCEFNGNGTALDFREALYGPAGNPDADASFVMFSTFTNNGLLPGGPPRC